MHLDLRRLLLHPGWLTSARVARGTSTIFLARVRIDRTPAHASCPRFGRARRAGELTAEEVERLVTIVQNPRQFKVPDWMLNRKKDTKDGKFSQTVSNTLDMKLREDLERLKKIRAHRGLRHYCT